MAYSLKPTNDFAFTEEFRTIIRSMKEHIIENAKQVDITNETQAFAHRNDFYKYLRINGTKEEMLWVISYINNIDNPNSDFRNMKRYLSVEWEFINALTKRIRKI